MDTTYDGINEYDPDEELHLTICPMCHGEANVLGKICGDDYCRCRYCGMDFWVKNEVDDA